MKKIIIILIVCFLPFFVIAQSPLKKLIKQQTSSEEIDLQNGMIAGYAFEETSGNLLDVVNSYDMTTNGTPTREVTGQVNDCYTLDGNQYFGYNTSTDLNLDEMTFSVWFKFSGSGFWGFGSNYEQDGDAAGWWISTEDADMRIRVDDGTGNMQYITSSGVTINNNSWHNVTFTSDADSIRLYIDGVWNVSGYFPYDVGAASQQSISSVLTGSKLVGSQDETIIWNRALSGEEIKDAYDKQVLGTTIENL